MRQNIFFKLWIPLLDFVNRSREIEKSFSGKTLTRELYLDALAKIRNVLWADRSLIDGYVELNPEKLSVDELGDIIRWKKAVCGTFVVLRHLKSGAIFLPFDESDRAYIVRGLNSTWDEMLEGASLPTIIETTLIPFRGVIISDGLAAMNRV